MTAVSLMTAKALRDVVSLSKPRITALVVATTAGGLFLAPGALTVASILMVLACTAMTVGAANTLNCYLERDVDGLMARTRGRPLPAGRLPSWVALAFGLVLAFLSVPLLAWLVNPVTAALASVALLSYVLVYTPMKLRSPVALFVGAIPGAIPPLMGYTAVTGRIEIEGLALFAILFIWQIPHFLAISIFRKNDYAGAGFKILPVVWGDRAARWHAVVWSALLLPVGASPWFLGMTGPVYGVVALLVGAAFLGLALRGLSPKADFRWARGFFFFTLLHLTALFTVLMLDAK